MLSRHIQSSINSLKLLSSVMLSCLVFASPSKADLNLQIGLGSEYIRQGLKESSGLPVVQAGAFYTHSTGLYSGAWGSMINQSKTDINSEVDFVGGWYLPVTTGLALDLGATRYTFHGDDEVAAEDYNEGFLNVLLWDSVTLGYRRSENFKNTDSALQTLELAKVFNGEEFGFELSVRQYRYLSINEDVNFGSDTRDNYFHFRLGVARSFNQNDYSLAFERTNLGSDYDGGTHILFNYTRNFDF